MIRAAIGGKKGLQRFTSCTCLLPLLFFAFRASNASCVIFGLPKKYQVLGRKSTSANSPGQGILPIAKAKTLLKHAPAIVLMKIWIHFTWSVQDSTSVCKSVTEKT